MAADVIYLRPSIQAPQRISPETDSDRLGVFIWQDIREYAIPFLQQFGSFQDALAAWEHGKFYNAKGFGVYLLAAAHFISGDKARAIEDVRRKIAEEERQIHTGAAPLGPLTSAEMDLVSRMSLRFDLMAAQELIRLRAFEQFLLNEAAP